MNQYQLRYKAFCQRLGIKDKNSIVENSEEHDRYDYLSSTYHYFIGDGYFRVITGINKPFVHYTGLLLPNSGEISRLCVDPDCDNKALTLERLLMGVIEIFLDNKIDYMCAMLEPWLIRTLHKHHGVVFENHGEPVEIFGKRIPVYDSFENMFNKWQEFNQ